MKKKNLFLIAGLLFIVLIAMCVGIYFLIKYGDKLKLDDKKEPEPVVEETKMAQYISRGKMVVYNDYLVEINDNNLKIMDYKTNILIDEDFEGAKYIKTYYGIDNNIYIITSIDYEENNLSDKVYNFKLSKVVDKEIEHVLDFNCNTFQFLNNNQKQVIGLSLDTDKEIIFYDGRYVDLNEYAISSLKVVDAYGFVYNNDNIIAQKCLLGTCSFAILNVSDGKVLPVSYDAIAALDNGNYRVKENGYYGIVSKDGNVILESIYDYIDVSNKDVLIALKDKKITIMDKEFKIINKDEIDIEIEKPSDEDLAINSNYNLVNASLVGDNYLINDNDKLYVINKEGAVEVKDNIKEFAYDSVLEKVLIYDWQEEDAKDKAVKEVWDKNLEKVDNAKKDFTFIDFNISVDSKHQATITKDGETVEEFYYDDETIVTDEYFLYYDSLKEETYYYYSV